MAQPVIKPATPTDSIYTEMVDFGKLPGDAEPRSEPACLHPASDRMYISASHALPRRYENLRLVEQSGSQSVESSHWIRQPGSLNCCRCSGDNASKG